MSEDTVYKITPEAVLSTSNQTSSSVALEVLVDAKKNRSVLICYFCFPFVAQTQILDSKWKVEHPLARLPSA